MVVPCQGLQRGMAPFQAQPEGPGLLLCRAALLVVHLEQPNHTPRALPCATAGSGAAFIKRQQSLKIPRMDLKMQKANQSPEKTREHCRAGALGYFSAPTRTVSEPKWGVYR
ncbi:hypothetical protein D3879_07335 [Pseudomonas cavernicola]|uniref:Uncharacterized protein n=1 Tax=Pseudomonas cavernicola TaxID=2320866 RepID=A0A418XKW5_9PSED|nr:hypothetical protein D3879_07335 [Pseudomonas cavernicola]